MHGNQSHDRQRVSIQMKCDAVKTEKRPVNDHAMYHAHVYFDANTLAFATRLYELIGQTFPLQLGRLHQRLVGPHTMWSYQILFSHDDFDQFIPWLDQQRGELSVLVHADTGDDLVDHTTHASWLGDAVDLDLSQF